LAGLRHVDNVTYGCCVGGPASRW